MNDGFEQMTHKGNAQDLESQRDGLEQSDICVVSMGTVPSLAILRCVLTPYCVCDERASNGVSLSIRSCLYTQFGVRALINSRLMSVCALFPFCPVPCDLD